eukprot:gnl/TRDRNA2_/TRDRNA2_145858_c0_seq1.p2 gnl/TRDRNA2_/TRDRNA2_145858_c0~~gnl/TRDRNA2_/TRDRNA2_145858_c0_seq1.p2  ORF type:complete len:117 (-),score=15.09 gnl/TRDRNA2_/TRDRNA2_145858_c0_seq1:389-739(-)
MKTVVDGLVHATMEKSGGRRAEIERGAVTDFAETEEMTPDVLDQEMGEDGEVGILLPSTSTLSQHWLRAGFSAASSPLHCCASVVCRLLLSSQTRCYVRTCCLRIATRVRAHRPQQ